MSSQLQRIAQPPQDARVVDCSIQRQRYRYLRRSHGEDDAPDALAGLRETRYLCRHLRGDRSVCPHDDRVTRFGDRVRRGLPWRGIPCEALPCPGEGDAVEALLCSTDQVAHCGVERGMVDTPEHNADDGDVLVAHHELGREQETGASFL